MITYQKHSQSKADGSLNYRFTIDCKKDELDTMPSFLLQNGSKAITTDEGKTYVYDKENGGWNERV